MQISKRDLEAVVARINRTVNGAELDPWTRDPAGPGEKIGRLHANVGVYHLDGAYGGWALHRMANEHGGAEDVFRSGHLPKRDLYERMQAFLTGLEVRS